MPKSAGKKGDIPPVSTDSVAICERFFQSSRPPISKVTSEVTMTGHNYIQPPSYSYPPSVFNSPTIDTSQLLPWVSNALSYYSNQQPSTAKL